MAKNYYKILELNETATAEEIKRAYRKLALKWHPDKWANKSLEERQQANEKIQEINQAYEILGDEEKKRRYDLGQTEFATTDDFDLKEWIRRENERINEEIGEIDDRLEKIKKLLKELAREEVAGNIRAEMLLNGVSRKHLDSNLWSPYGSIEEKVWNIEIGDDENDREGIDKRKLNEFKEKMAEAIREKKIQLTEEKMAKASSDLERVRLKAIKEIERELQNRGLKIEDLEEEYHNYEEEINGLTKKFKIYSYEDKVIEVIRRKSQSGSSGEFKLKKSDFSWEESEQSEGNGESNYTPLNDDKKPYKELEPIADDKKEPQKSNSKYDNWTKEELIREIEQGKLDNNHLQKLVASLKAKIKEIEEEIRELKQEKEDTPEFNEYISKKENELRENKQKLEKLASYDYRKFDGKQKPKNPNNFPTSLVLVGVVVVFGLLMVILIASKNKKKK